MRAPNQQVAERASHLLLAGVAQIAETIRMLGMDSLAVGFGAIDRTERVAPARAVANDHARDAVIVRTLPSGGRDAERQRRDITPWTWGVPPDRKLSGRAWPKRQARMSQRPIDRLRGHDSEGGELASGDRDHACRRHADRVFARRRARIF